MFVFCIKSVVPSVQLIHLPSMPKNKSALLDDFQKVKESDEAFTSPMLTTFLAFVMMFVIPYTDVVAFTLPLLMLFRTDVFGF